MSRFGNPNHRKQEKQGRAWLHARHLCMVYFLENQMEVARMYVVAGLGNPGPKYDQTRHNVGFMALDYLAAQYRIPVGKAKFHAVLGEGVIQGEKVILVKPQTYMNCSGDSLQELLHFYKVPPEQLIVIYDDVDLDVGKLRIRPKGSSGTHNGMRSIVSRLSSEAFPRVRIGIGKPPEKMQLADYVLSRFLHEERTLLAETIERASLAVTAIICSGIDAAMNRYNG